MKTLLAPSCFVWSSSALAVGSSSLPEEGPGFIAQLIMGAVGAGILLTVLGAFVLLVVMAAQAMVLGRPTLPPKS